MKEALEHKNELWTENVEKELGKSEVGTRSMHVRALGKLSVTALRLILASARACFIPTVKAAPPPSDPIKPPPMKYKDLPLYDCPHFKYKDFISKKPAKCPDQKIIHTMLLPHVSKYRKEACKAVCGVKTEVLGFCNNTRNCLVTNFSQTKDYCRSPAHETERKAIMVAAPILGGLIACGGKPTRLFGATAAAAAAGAMCYPKPTDKVFKSVLKCVAVQVVAVYNFCCRGNVTFKETVCPIEYPATLKPPPKPMDNKCPPKK